MSKPISEEEYKKKLFNRVHQWIRGEADPYVGNVETKEQHDYTPNEKVLERHQEDREQVIKNVFGEWLMELDTAKLSFYPQGYSGDRYDYNIYMEFSNIGETTVNKTLEIQ